MELEIGRHQEELVFLPVVVEVQVSLHGRRHTVGASEPAEAWRDRDELVKDVS